MSKDAIELLPALAMARARALPGRLRRGTALALLSRWCGMLGVALQSAVARAALHHAGADLRFGTPGCHLSLADLAVSPWGRLARISAAIVRET